MAVSAKFDKAKLERGLRRFAAIYGETQSQAVVRWSVQTCRELAFESQVWGRSKTKGKQDGKIISDALNVCLVVDSLTKAPTGSGYRASNMGKSYHVVARRVLLTADAVNNWIELNRTRRRRNTAKLPINERMVCQSSIFKKAMTIRKKKSGMAKGGWIGAGHDIAKAQTGQDKIQIGKSYMAYTQKAGASYGSAKKPKSGFKPAAYITNSVEHTASNDVLAKSGIQKAIEFGLKKSINYYRSALRALAKKNL